MQTATRTLNEYPTTPKTSVFRTLRQSQFVWIVCIVFGLDLFLWFVKPLRFFDSNFVFADADPLADKVHAMCSPVNRYNAVVLGSSLAVCAVTVPDFLENGKTRMPHEDLKRYTRARVLDRMLSKCYGTEIESFNASMYGLMMCENLALLKSALKTNNHIKYAVLMIAPRDFLDNYKMSEEKSYVVSFLKDTDLGVFSLKRSFQDNFNFSLRQIWRLYDIRADYLKISEALTCGWLRRAPSLYAAVSSKGDYRGTRFDIKFIGAAGQILEDKHATGELFAGGQGYEGRYLPIDVQKYVNEMNCLRKFVSLCSDRKIQPIILNMPLEPSNYNILPKAFLQKYMNECASICSQKGVIYLNLMKNPIFKSPDDFHDNAHLSSRGAKKLYKMIADKIGESLIVD